MKLLFHLLCSEIALTHRLLHAWLSSCQSGQEVKMCRIPPVVEQQGWNKPHIGNIKCPVTIKHSRELQNSLKNTNKSKVIWCFYSFFFCTNFLITVQTVGTFSSVAALWELKTLLSSCAATTQWPNDDPLWPDGFHSHHSSVFFSSTDKCAEGSGLSVYEVFDMVWEYSAYDLINDTSQW